MPKRPDPAPERPASPSGPLVIAPADPESTTARACLLAYFTLLADRIDGISHSHVPDPDPEADAYRLPKGAFLLACVDNVPAACVALKTLTPGVGEVKRLWVDPAARGHGLARRMMLAIEDQARSLGHHTLKLDTNEHLPEAIALYRATGWSVTAPYTGWPATHWFEKTL